MRDEDVGDSEVLIGCADAHRNLFGLLNCICDFEIHMINGFHILKTEMRKLNWGWGMFKEEAMQDARAEEEQVKSNRSKRELTKDEEIYMLQGKGKSKEETRGDEGARREAHRKYSGGFLRRDHLHVQQGLHIILERDSVSTEN